jgi:hypothetical protein
MKTSLLHREVIVKLVDTITPDEGEGFNFGHTEAGNTAVVVIAEDIANDTDFADTVLHELMHVVEFTCGLELKHHQVYTLAAGLTQLLVGLNLIHPPTWRAQIRSARELEKKIVET